MTFVIKRGDTAPVFDKDLRNEFGVIVDITNYQSVDFHMRDDDYNIVIDDDTNGNVSVTDAAKGSVEYSWQAGDTDALGSYEAEFVVTFSDGSTRSFPVLGRYDIEIVEDVQ